MSTTTPPAKVSRVAYAVFADNGNIRCFSTQRDHPSLKALEDKGADVVTLTEQGAPIAVAALENDSYVITGIEDRCLKALRQRVGQRGTAMIELYPGEAVGLFRQAKGGQACGAVDNMLDAINQCMNAGSCPTTGSLGECAAIDQVAPSIYEAYLYIWDHEFDDSAEVARWFIEQGATGVTVALTLYSDHNGDRAGRTLDGAREWCVTYSMLHATPSGSPEGLLSPALEGGA